MEDGEEGSVVEVGEQVVVAGKRVGVVKYAGDTNFAPGRCFCWWWCCW